LDEHGAVIGDVHGDAGRQGALDLRPERADVLDDAERVAGGRHLDAEEDGVLAVHRHGGVGVLRPERHLGDVLDAHQGAVPRLHHHALERVDIGEAGIGGDVGDGVVALALARRRLEVVGADRLRHVVGRDAARRHAQGIEPDAHGKGLSAEDLGLGHAVDGRHQRLDDAREIVGDRRVRHRVAGKADIHDVGGLSGLLDDDRVLRLGRDQKLDLLHLGHDVGHRLVRIVVEPDIGLDRARPLDRVRGDVVEPLGRRHRLLDRRGDEPLDELRRRAGIERGDGDDRVLQLRILPDRQVEAGDGADQQDEQAHHHREDRTTDEEIGEAHRFVPPPRGAVIS
jgi:hypothetical protein